MLKKILFATALALGFTASFAGGKAAVQTGAGVELVGSAGACGDPTDCYWPCYCQPPITKP